MFKGECTFCFRRRRSLEQLCEETVDVECSFYFPIANHDFSFVQQWEIYDAYVEDLQKQVRR